MSLVEPLVTGSTARPGGISLDLFVPHDLYYFQGHFPGTPVLAGIVQVCWAIALAEKYLGATGTFKGIRGLKFQHVIVPDQDINLALTHEVDRRELSFCYSSELGPHSRGRIIFR